MLTAVEAHEFAHRGIEAFPTPGFASRFTIQVEMDDEGRLSQIYTVLASRKLTAVAAPQNAK